MMALTQPTDALVRESRAVLRKHGRSFSWAAPFLPRAARDDAALVYAFCRLVDDTADEAASLEEARAGLQHLEDEVFGVTAPRPIVRAYLEVVERRGIPRGAARGLLDGARSDTDARVLLADDEALARYCFQVAGTVGMMMRAILDGDDAAARAPAVALGVGMQLTNICRDVAEDARKDRVYLPSTLLVAHGVTADDVLAIGGAHGANGAHDTKKSAPRTRHEQHEQHDRRTRVAIVNVVRALLARAEEQYAWAGDGLPFLPWRARIGVAVALRLYRAIGVEVARLGVVALERRAVVPVWRKAIEVVAGVVLALTARAPRGA